MAEGVQAQAGFSLVKEEPPGNSPNKLKEEDEKVTVLYERVPRVEHTAEDEFPTFTSIVLVKKESTGSTDAKSSATVEDKEVTVGFEQAPRAEHGEAELPACTSVVLVKKEPTDDESSDRGENKDVDVLHERGSHADHTQDEFVKCTSIALVKHLEPIGNTGDKMADSGEGEDVDVLYERVPNAVLSDEGLDSEVTHQDIAWEKRIKPQIDESAIKRHKGTEDSHAQALGSDNRSAIGDALYKFIENKVVSIQKDTKSEKASNIQKAVAESVQYLLNEVEEIEPVFKISELIQVGSYAEGTKIDKPDEFDFLAVVDALSKEGAIIINQKEDTWCTGSVSLHIGDISEDNELSKFCEKGELQCFQNKPLSQSFRGATRFGTTFIKAVTNTFKQRLLKLSSSGKMSMFSPVEAILGSRMIFPSMNGTILLLKQVEFKTPNILLQYELEGLEIGVDLSPAIRYHKIEDCINPEKCASPDFLDAIRQQGSVLLVGDKLGGFRISVTESEVKYMQEIMRARHKLLYIFFKHICENWKPFTSYMLKQICIHHDAKCVSDTDTMASCLGKMIHDIALHCTNRELPCVHNKDIDLTRSSIGEFEDWHMRIHFLIALRELQQYSIENRNKEGFEAILHDAINRLRDKLRNFHNNPLRPLNESFDVGHVVLSTFSAHDDRLFCSLCDGDM